MPGEREAGDDILEGLSFEKMMGVVAAVAEARGYLILDYDIRLDPEFLIRLRVVKRSGTSS